MKVFLTNMTIIGSDTRVFTSCRTQIKIAKIVSILILKEEPNYFVLIVNSLIP